MAGPYDIFPQMGVAPNRELASISGLLSAIADRRIQQQQAEYERERRAYEFAQLEKNRIEDNRREAERIKMQDKLQRDQMEQARVLKEREIQEARNKEARGAMPDIRKAMLSQDPETAEFIARNYGIQMAPAEAIRAPQPTAPNLVDVGPMPQAPQAEPSPLPGAPALPPDTAGYDQQLQDWQLDTLGNEYQQDKYAQETAAAEAENARRQQAVKGTYAFTMPAGTTSFMSTVADARARMAQAQTALEEFDRTVGPSAADKYQKEAFRRVRAALGSGQLPTEQGKAIEMYNKLEADLRSDDLQRELARIGAAGRKDTGERGDRRLDLSEAGEARQLAKDVMSGLGYQEAQVQNHKFNKIARMLQAGNAALDTATVGTWVKEAQGGTGVISDADMAAFYEKIGGKPQNWAQFIQDFIDGKIVGSRRAEILGAARELAGIAQAKLSKIKDAMRSSFQTHTVLGNKPQHEKWAMTTYFEDETNKYRAERKAQADAATEETLDELIRRKEKGKKK